MESGIKKTVHRIYISKLSLCIALAQIKRKKLYEQIDIVSFKEYIRKNRININYNTAFEYTKIGEAYLDYHIELVKINFNEENGLKKLLFLKKALDNYKEKPEIVYNSLKCNSFRTFKMLADHAENNIKKSARANYNIYINKNENKNQKIKNDDECIYLDPEGTELLWFNFDLNTNPMYQEFQKLIIKTTKQFFLLKNLNKNS